MKKIIAFGVTVDFQTLHENQTRKAAAYFRLRETSRPDYCPPAKRVHARPQPPLAFIDPATITAALGVASTIGGIVGGIMSVASYFQDQRYHRHSLAELAEIRDSLEKVKQALNVVLDNQVKASHKNDFYAAYTWLFDHFNYIEVAFVALRDGQLTIENVVELASAIGPLNLAFYAISNAIIAPRPGIKPLLRAYSDTHNQSTLDTALFLRELVDIQVKGLLMMGVAHKMMGNPFDPKPYLDQIDQQGRAEGVPMHGVELVANPTFTSNLVRAMKGIQTGNFDSAAAGLIAAYREAKLPEQNRNTYLKDVVNMQPKTSSIFALGWELLNASDEIGAAVIRVTFPQAVQEIILHWKTSTFGLTMDANEFNQSNWQLASHQYYASDTRDENSTYACVLRPRSHETGLKWHIVPVNRGRQIQFHFEDNTPFSKHTGWLLSAHRFYDRTPSSIFLRSIKGDVRDSGSTYVCIIEPGKGEHLNWELVPTNDNRFQIVLEGWQLTAHRYYSRDHRDGMSTFAIVHQNHSGTWQVTRN